MPKPGAEGEMVIAGNMFTPVSRRLALLNAVVVLGVMIASALATYVLVRRNLDHRVDDTLHERVEAVADAWGPLLATGQPIPNPGFPAGSDVPDGDDSHSTELLESDTVLYFAFDATGQQVIGPSGFSASDLPVREAVERALRGHHDTRVATVDGNQRVRLRTEPIEADDRIVGVVQGVHGLAEHEAELHVLAIWSIAGAAVGGLLAVPAGMFLSRRAMRPIGVAFERQRAFVADASHELRTPLAVMRANTELVQRMPDLTPAELRGETDALLDEIDSMSRLVDDLLTLARADSGELAMHRERIDLSELGRETTQAMSALAREHGLTVAVDAEEPVEIEADPDRLRQVTRILLHNAISYTPSGGTVILATRRSGRTALLEVRDTGIGIAAEDQRHVFRRFYRADKARSRATGGTGLGLPIAQAIVTAHGGHIALESSSGQGTRVWFTLPAASTRHDASHAPVTADHA